MKTRHNTSLHLATNCRESFIVHALKSYEIKDYLPQLRDMLRDAIRLQDEKAALEILHYIPFALMDKHMAPYIETTHDMRLVDSAKFQEIEHEVKCKFKPDEFIDILVSFFSDEKRSPATLIAFQREVIKKIVEHVYEGDPKIVVHLWSLVIMGCYCPELQKLLEDGIRQMSDWLRSRKCYEEIISLANRTQFRDYRIKDYFIRSFAIGLIKSASVDKVFSMTCPQEFAHHVQP